MNQPAFDPDEQPVIPIPSRHRALSPGEPLRRDDKLYNAEVDGWIKISEELRGTLVPIATEAGGKRYCRPTHPDFQVWFVDLRPDKGSKDALGGPTDPFDSLESAVEGIDKAADDAGRAPFGLIVDQQGTPLSAYDLPEPPADSYYAQLPPIFSVPGRSPQPGPELPNRRTDSADHDTEPRTAEFVSVERACENAREPNLVNEMKQLCRELRRMRKELKRVRKQIKRSRNGRIVEDLV